MNGDQAYLEILQGQARIETHVDELNKKMDQMCDFKDTSIKIFQEFEDYKKNRIDLPEDLQELKDLTTGCRTNCDNHRKLSQKYFDKTDFLMTWYWRLAGAVIVVQFIMAVFIALLTAGMIHI
jgi:hypothetical protein